MLVIVDSSVTPSSAARMVNERTFAEWMTFLLGGQAMFGQDAPMYFRSTTAARWPSPAVIEARYLLPRRCR